jgi:hypothetical protein
MSQFLHESSVPVGALTVRALDFSVIVNLDNLSQLVFGYIIN